MKRQIIVFVAALLLSHFLVAQVMESDEHMAAGTFNALSIELDVTDTRLADRVWKDYMKGFGGKLKKVKGGSETVTSGASMVGVNGVGEMLVYAKLSGGSGSNVMLTIWFDLGEEYLNSSMKDKFSAAAKILTDFATEVKAAATENELSDQEKKLRSLESDLDKLERQNKSYHKDIEDAERKIAQAKENIIKNEGQQAEAGQRIELQKQVVQEVKSRLETIRKN